MTESERQNDKKAEEAAIPSKRADESGNTEQSDEIASGEDSQTQQILEALFSPLDESDESGERAAVLRRIISQFSGPLPPPEMMGEYEEVLPGSADRILEMAEKEQGMRKTQIDGFISNDRRKINGSIFISALLIVAAAFAAYLGEPYLAAALGLGGVLNGTLKVVLEWIRGDSSEELKE